VAPAFEKGACAAVVALDWPVPSELQGKALLRVADPRQALADLARAQRRAWGGPSACDRRSRSRPVERPGSRSAWERERRAGTPRWRRPRR
jgi:hypothetical protein